jgi:hypothetical protein
MKVIERGPKENRVWHLEVSGFFFLGRWNLVKMIEKMPNATILDKSVIRNWIKNKPFLRFKYRDIDFSAEMESFSGNHIEISPEPVGYKPETLEIKEYLLGLKFPYL